jgi:hypothetical protein
MKKIVTLFIAVMMCIVLLSLPVSVMASTSVEKQTAIDNGLAYLNGSAVQNATYAYWNYSGYEPAVTAAVLLSFADQAYKPLGWNGGN